MSDFSVPSAHVMESCGTRSSFETVTCVSLERNADLVLSIGAM